MAFATELTLTTGQTVYEGDPENDGRIQSREVRVSVTYSLERHDQDTQTVAIAKTPEVEATLAAAWQQVRACKGCPAIAASKSPVDDEQEDDEPDSTGTPPIPPPNGGVPTNGHCQHTPVQATRFGSASRDTLIRSTVPHQNGSDDPFRRIGSATAIPSRAGAVATATRPAEVPAVAAEEGITKPQLLAIKGACGRLRLSDFDLFQMLDQKYAVKRLEQLTKAHAAKLLHSLQQHEWQGSDGPEDDDE